MESPSGLPSIIPRYLSPTLDPTLKASGASGAAPIRLWRKRCKRKIIALVTRPDLKWLLQRWRERLRSGRIRRFHCNRKTLKRNPRQYFRPFGWLLGWLWLRIRRGWGPPKGRTKKCYGKRPRENDSERRFGIHWWVDAKCSLGQGRVLRLFRELFTQKTEEKDMVVTHHNYCVVRWRRIGKQVVSVKKMTNMMLCRIVCWCNIPHIYVRTSSCEKQAKCNLYVEQINEIWIMSYVD